MALFSRRTINVEKGKQGFQRTRKGAGMLPAAGNVPPMNVPNPYLQQDSRTAPLRTLSAAPDLDALHSVTVPSAGAAFAETLGRSSMARTPATGYANDLRLAAQQELLLARSLTKEDFLDRLSRYRDTVQSRQIQDAVDALSAAVQSDPAPDGHALSALARAFSPRSSSDALPTMEEVMTVARETPGASGAYEYWKISMERVGLGYE